MSLLKELRDEAQRKKSAAGIAPDDVGDASNGFAIDTDTRTTIVFKMKAMKKLAAVQTYLKDVADQLNVLDRDIAVNYDVPGYGAMPNLRQGNYRVNDTALASGRLGFQFDCAGRGQIKSAYESKAEFLTHKIKLKEQGLKVDSEG